jgi:hypothetical protein
MACQRPALYSFSRQGAPGRAQYGSSYGKISDGSSFDFRDWQSPKRVAV